MTHFSLHPQLAKDCVHVKDLAACSVLLMNNATFPWLVLVPMRDGMRELHELSDVDFTLVMDEVRRTMRVLHDMTEADKMNVAALGNMVPQLHIHIIARFKNDAAWPQPVWNSGISAKAYDAQALSHFVTHLQTLIT
ncbi:MAG: HIT domain-containing protein [Rickettsiales bacterium]|nr:HIT domain-containing protein [Rickettsiales bacterium]